jgi:hypothetical protein
MSADHPAPWKWEGNSDDQWILRDAYGNDLLDARAESAYGEGWSAGGVSPTHLARELIRLAPEMEALLRDSDRNECHCADGTSGAGGRPRGEIGPCEFDPECWVNRQAKIIAALDSARKAGG